MPLYPLKFNPVFKYRIWGGNKLKTVLNKQYEHDNIGESWEISSVEGDETLVANGTFLGYTIKQLIAEFKSDLVGTSVYDKFGEEFPLLIKFIDAATPLSIQVHPNDELAKKRHNSFGKEEMWHIIEADTDAELTVGFKNNITKSEFKKRIKNTTITDVLNIEKVKEGDTYHIKGGIIHAIGAGVLLAEIQQTSDITYRIYDYDRIDAKTGEKRALHTELALDAIDFNIYNTYKTAYNTTINTNNPLVYAPFFKTNFIPVNGILQKDYSKIDSFIIYICVNGTLTINTNNHSNTIQKGECILIPACFKMVTLKAESAKLLEVYI